METGLDTELLRETCKSTKDYVGSMVRFLNIRDTIKYYVSMVDKKYDKGYKQIVTEMAFRFFYDEIYFREVTFNESRLMQEFDFGR